MKKVSAPVAPEEIRILRLFSRLNIGGPSVHVILLSAGLRAHGYQTRLVVGQEGEREGNLLALAEERGVSCAQMNGLGREIHLLADLAVILRLRRLMREFRPVIVHTHTAKAGVVGRLAARLAGVPIVVHTFHGHVLRGYFGPVKTALFRGLERWLGRSTHALLAVSEAVKQDLVGFGVAPSAKIRVVPLGLELEPLAGALPRGVLRGLAGVPAAATLVGMVGRLVPIKDIPTFLEAAAILHKSLPGCHFAIVGDGQERALLEARAWDLGLSDLVHFLGWRRDMDAVYGDLDLVVNSSLNEGTPVALIEALAAGRPVVATRVGGTPDLLGAQERGLLVPPRDPVALAQAMLDCLQQPAAAAARARVGQAYVLSHHGVGRLIGDIDMLYRELLTGAAGVA
jgi:glycosyltransferase involved in cell wall biosynthesis